MGTSSTILKILSVLCAVFLMANCKPVEPGPEPTTGSLLVGIEFGMGTETAHPCSGGGKLIITSPDGTDELYEYRFSGLSNHSYPACSTSLTLTNLQPGSWNVRDTETGVSCQKQVAVGRLTTITIQTDRRHCEALLHK